MSCFNAVKLFGLLFLVGLCNQRLYAESENVSALMPENYMFGESHESPFPVDDKWWNLFGDSMLNSLIATGCENNYNILTAIRRIAISQQNVRQARAAYYPTLDLSFGWSRNRSSGYAGSAPSPAVVSSAFDLGLNMSWEIDLFGKITSRVKESGARRDATKAEYNGAMVSLCAEIATQYCALRTYQSEYAVAEKHIKSQEEVLKIVEARYQAGLASKLDVAQAKTIFYSTESLLPQLQSSIDVTINALAVLVGVYPTDIHEQLSVVADQPDYRQIVGTGVPMDLLRRRPDIIAAEYDLAASAAALGVAKKDFLPTLTLQGSIGTMAHSAKNMFKNESFTYSIAPTLSWTVFDGFSRSAASVAAREQVKMSIDQYNLTVLTAVQEVENALAQYYNTLKELELIESTLDEANEAFRLSLDLYKGGLSDFTDVANAQISILQYADRLTTTRGAAATQLINIYRSLGGGWN